MESVARFLLEEVYRKFARFSQRRLQSPVALDAIQARVAEDAGELGFLHDALRIATRRLTLATMWTALAQFRVLVLVAHAAAMNRLIAVHVEVARVAKVVRFARMTQLEIAVEIIVAFVGGVCALAVEA